MPDEPQQTRAARPRTRLPRVSDLFDVTDDMIAFADKYQQMWENEARATLALGEFLSARSAALKTQVELMKMGSDSFRKYNDWSEAIFGVRPESLMRGVLDTMDRMRPQPKNDGDT